MLEQRQQRHRRQAVQRGFGGEPREHAGRRVGQRVAAGIVHRHVPARQRRQHAAGQRPVGRHQRGGLAGIVHRLAQRNRNRQRLLLGVGGLDHRDAGERGIGMSGETGVRQALLPKLARGGGPQRLRRQAFAAVRFGRRRARHAVADECRSSAAAPTWRTADGHARLRCRRRGRRSFSRSLRRDRCRGRAAPARRAAASRWWRAASRSPGSSRSSPPRSPGRRWSQGAWLRPRSACRGARPARCGLFPSRTRRPVPRDEFQEAAACSPSIRPCRSGTRSSSRSQRHLPRRHVIHQPGQILRQRQRRGRAVGDERRVVAAARRDRLRPISG